MISIQQAARSGVAILAVAVTSACSSAGGLGNILGGVLGQGGNQGQVSGYVRGINTRNQQLSLQDNNGQTVTLNYDNRTQVVYQNQNYSVNSLEQGDQVTARIVNGNNNSQYYTDLIQVDRSVSGTNNNGGVYGGNTNNAQLYEGTVRNIDRNNGLFQLTGTNYGGITVSMPYNVRQQDINKFNSLRNGDYVRLYGVVISNQRVELRQFN